jgi:hypothetical protein
LCLRSISFLFNLFARIFTGSFFGFVFVAPLIFFSKDVQIAGKKFSRRDTISCLTSVSLETPTKSKKGVYALPYVFFFNLLVLNLIGKNPRLEKFRV